MSSFFLLLHNLIFTYASITFSPISPVPLLCLMRKITATNNFAVVFPELAKEWHPTLNGNITPRNVFHNSNEKVLWQCWKGHEWQAFIYSRSAGCGCPYCSGRRKYVTERIMEALLDGV